MGLQSRYKAIAALVAVLGLLAYASHYSRAIEASVSAPAANVATSISKAVQPGQYVITNTVSPGQTLSGIFALYNLSPDEMEAIRLASKKQYNLTMLRAGHTYRLTINRQTSTLREFFYQIDRNNVLNIHRQPGGGFSARRSELAYDKTIAHIGGTIGSNLSNSMQDIQLALALSDIFAWDMDFTTDLRKGDSFRIIAESLTRGGQPAGYGRILAAEFNNNGRSYKAYAFENGKGVDYYDEQGKSLKRAFLKAPLSYRRISSGFSRSRLHPVLRTYRPHLGVDYAAARGTPVSSIGDGVIEFAARKGPNGRLIIIRHMAGFKSYYGHLNRIKRGIRRGVRVKQGQLIGTVGSTGRATGPHLDFRLKKSGRFINPLKLRMPRGKSVSKSQQLVYQRRMDELDSMMDSIAIPNSQPDDARQAAVYQIDQLR